VAGLLDPGRRKGDSHRQEGGGGGGGGGALSGRRTHGRRLRADSGSARRARHVSRAATVVSHYSRGTNAARDDIGNATSRSGVHPLHQWRTSRHLIAGQCRQQIGPPCEIRVAKKMDRRGGIAFRSRGLHDKYKHFPTYHFSPLRTAPGSGGSAPPENEK